MPILHKQQKIIQEQQKTLQEQMLKQMVLMNENAMEHSGSDSTASSSNKEKRGNCCC
jgi:hypothetical protein